MKFNLIFITIVFIVGLFSLVSRLPVNGADLLELDLLSLNNVFIAVITLHIIRISKNSLLITKINYV